MVREFLGFQRGVVKGSSLCGSFGVLAGKKLLMI
jgi:hypothetical protein